MDFVYFEIKSTQFNYGYGLIRYDCFLNHMFYIKIIHFDTLVEVKKIKYYLTQGIDLSFFF